MLIDSQVIDSIQSVLSHSYVEDNSIGVSKFYFYYSISTSISNNGLLNYTYSLRGGPSISFVFHLADIDSNAVSVSKGTKETRMSVTCKQAIKCIDKPSVGFGGTLEANSRASAILVFDPARYSEVKDATEKLKSLIP